MRQASSISVIAATLAVLLCGSARIAQASPIIVGATSEASGGLFYSPYYMDGYDFTTTVDQSLTALGFWDYGMNGLPASYQVGLWATSGQSLLASATINSADPLDVSVTVLGGQWRYETLAAPVALSAGTTYTIAWLMGGPDTHLTTDESLSLLPSTSTVNPTITLIADRFLQTSSFTFPTGSGSINISLRGQVNAQLAPLDSSTVPEPATFSLLGLGLVGAAVARYRRRK